MWHPSTQSIVFSHDFRNVQCFYVLTYWRVCLVQQKTKQSKDAAKDIISEEVSKQNVFHISYFITKKILSYNVDKVNL